MTEDDAQSAFDRWVADYKRDLPGGNTVSVFLSTDHLRRAFLAGFRAASLAGQQAPR
jgi:hypothetical protein